MYHQSKVEIYKNLKQFEYQFQFFLFDEEVCTQPQNVIKWGKERDKKKTEINEIEFVHFVAPGLAWCFSSFRKFPKLQIAGCEEKCNTMVST